jgi:hypothetical protein
MCAYSLQSGVVTGLVMASLKTSAFEARGRCREGQGGDIVKMGYLRKLKVCNSICCKDLCTPCLLS